MYAAVWPHSGRRCVWPFDRVATTSGGRRHSFADLASGTRWKVRNLWRWTSNNVFCPEESEAGAHFCKTHLWLCRLVWRYVEREKRQCTFVFNFKRISWICLRSQVKHLHLEAMEETHPHVIEHQVRCYCVPLILLFLLRHIQSRQSRGCL